MIPKKVLFFADRLPPLIGGMEVHAKYFIDYFSAHRSFPLAAVVSKEAGHGDVLIKGKLRESLNLKSAAEKVNPDIIFFNSGCWIEEMQMIRAQFPFAKFIYRTGGNEILKAPLVRRQINSHRARQEFWVNQLNRNVDLLVTNSKFTEARLDEIGITCPFFRCVGGVNTDALKTLKQQKRGFLQIFCAARFVPYKNHALLLNVLQLLSLKGHNFNLKLAGDGPLEEQARHQAIDLGLGPYVEFLGPLDHESCCREISNCDVYMQFSTDHMTDVPGGKYLHCEGMGRSILEAISAGIFVIAGRCGALSEVVTCGKGLLVELESPAKIAEQLDDVMKKIPRCLPASEEYSWPQVFALYEKVFAQMVG